MSARKPRHPVECQGHIVVREPVWDLVSGNHQGQQPCTLRKQAGHTTASDKRLYQLKKCLAMQEPSTQDMPVAKDRPVLRELQAGRTALIKKKVRLQNQLDKQTHRLTQKLTRRRLRQVMSDLAELDQARRSQLESCPIRKRRLHLIQSIKGIGAVAATTIPIVPLGTLLRNALPVSECLKSAA